MEKELFYYKGVKISFVTSNFLIGTAWDTWDIYISIGFIVIDITRKRRNKPSKF